ncbi:MAG: tetratricopeptide repeat protein [Bryobacteraceae bacterium]
MPRTRPKPPPAAVLKAPPAPVHQPRPSIWICLALLAVTFAVYAPVRHFDFVNFDDPEMVSANPHVRQGMTPAGIAWALTSVEAANWFPVTRLSHMLDAQFFGLGSGWHHAVNVLLHALAAMALFAFLDRATHTRWPSALVALVFALHPLHVESVAWVSERKDVLSALFWFLALWAYVRYTERPGLGRYLALIAWFVLGLMSKPMIVTLPLVLLLVDFWPLGRPLGAALLREKIPLFALSAVASVATYLVQRRSGAVESLAAFPVGLRVENALVSCCTYIAKMFWPSGLAVFYPYPAAVPLWQAALAAAALAAVTVVVVRAWRRAPYLAAGWFWYLGTLLPVAGLVQVGAQARADRYTYVPMIGLAIALVWGGADLLRRAQRAPQGVPIALAAAVALACVPATWAQVAHWRNSETLFRHALAVTRGNYVAEHNLGNYLMDVPGRLPEAIGHLEASLRIHPESARAHTDLGTALARMPGRLPEAIAEYRAALRLAPDAAIPHNNLGNTLAKTGRLPEAMAEYETALRLDPEYAEAHNNLGSALMKLGRPHEAIANFQTAVRLDPGSAEAHYNLGSALAETPGGQSEAIGEYLTALRLNPNSAEAHLNLGIAMAGDPARLPEAIAEYEAALRLNPDSAEAHNNLGSALANYPARLAEAVEQYRTALRLNPDSAEVHNNLGSALAKLGRPSEAIAEYQAALRLKPDYAEAHINLGASLAPIPGRLPEAIAHFEAALRANPDSADAHYNLGVALSNLPGRLPEALAHLEAALRLKPDPELQREVERLRAGAR